MNIRFVTLGLLAALLLPLHSEDNLAELRQDHQRLQSAYQQRLQEIQQELRSAETNILNQFIVSLVRVERNFRDDGNLDGVVLSRELREALLEEPAFPEPEDRFPKTLRDKIQEIHDQRQDARHAFLEKRDDLNRIFAERLEPVMRDLTRAGDFDTAREILSLRRELLAALGREEQPDSPSVRERNLGVPGDPNTYPFSLEPDFLGQLVGLTPRKTQLPYQLQLSGNAEIRERDFRLRRGKMSIPADAMDALVYQVKQNQMLTLEFGFRTNRPRQLPAGVPTPVFYFGEDLETANLALTHQDNNLHLLLRTTSPPDNRDLHRVNLGSVDGGRMEHLLVTYRPGELTIYRDGAETRKLRGEVTGSLSNWQSHPFHLGEAPSPDPELPHDLHWNGQVVMLYFRATHESTRTVTSHYNRFADFVTSP